MCNWKTAGIGREEEKKKNRRFGAEIDWHLRLVVEGRVGGDPTPEECLHLR